MMLEMGQQEFSCVCFRSRGLSSFLPVGFCYNPDFIPEIPEMYTLKMYLSQSDTNEIS